MFLDIFVKLVLILQLCFQLSSALFEGCDYALSVDTRGMYINSPYYGQNYPSGSSCRYTVQGPLDYQLRINCNLSMPTSPNTQSGCGTELFYVEADGNSNYPITGSAFFCGQRNIVGTSYFNTAVIAYTSSGGGTGKFSCFIQAVPQSCDCGWAVSTKITNGIETKINEYPLMAGLIYLGTSKIFCGATIISHRYLMSAAHCFSQYNNPSEIVASVGEHDVTKSYETYYSRIVGIQQIIRHSGYDSSNQRNDIAVVQTSKDILWSGGVGPACLPFLLKYSTFANQPVDIIGWGSTGFGYPPSDFLRKATVYAIDNTECAKVITDLNPGQICTYSPPKDACSFDSGGPVVYKYQRSYSVAITSFGIGCGINKPSVNTRVTYYLEWIQSVTPGVAYCQK